MPKKKKRRRDFALTIPLSPPASASKLSLKAEIAASERPAATIFSRTASNEGAMMAMNEKKKKKMEERKRKKKKEKKK